MAAFARLEQQDPTSSCQSYPRYCLKTYRAGLQPLIPWFPAGPWGFAPGWYRAGLRPFLSCQKSSTCRTESAESAIDTSPGRSPGIWSEIWVQGLKARTIERFETADSFPCLSGLPPAAETALSTGHYLDFKQLRPELAGYEETIPGRIIGDTVEDGLGIELIHPWQHPFEIDPTQDHSRLR